jgi:hypothetical protein
MHIKYPSVVFCLLFAIAFSVDSCVSHDLDPAYTCDDVGVVSYSSTVKTIVQTKCAIEGCHNGSNPQLPNWTDFSTFKGRVSDIKRRILAREMPPSDSPNGPLEQHQINKIACWVDQGAENN